ncbi:MAG: outer membrane lipoprotein-sorting protein [Myxococcota bacterium]
MLTLLLSLVAPASAETADQILERARAANQVESSIEGVTMVIVSKSGSEKSMSMEIRTRREAGVTKTHLKVMAPSDVAGTQLLQIDNPNVADEQMMYFPAFKRVNQISGSARSGRFLGSDFTYEDLEIRESATGTHTMVSDTAESWTIDTAMTNSSYSKVRATIGKADLVLRKVEFYSGESVVKVLEVKRTEKDGAATLPVESEMTDLKAGTKTRLVITSHKLNLPKTDLPDDTFTKAYLERGG